jgi:hypothetical protein
VRPIRLRSGGTHASYIYRLLAEFYSSQDINLRSLNPTQM